MKSRDFAKILSSFADVIAAAGNPIAKEKIGQLADIFSIAPDSNISQIVQRMTGQTFAAQGSRGWKLDEALPLISSLKNLLAEADAKKAVLSDVDRVEGMLVSLSGINIDDLRELANRTLGRSSASTQDIRKDVVAVYLGKLIENYKEESGFSDVFGELKGLTDAELCALAAQFALPATSRKEALKNIKDKHTTWMEGKARSEATGKRIAG